MLAKPRLRWIAFCSGCIALSISIAGCQQQPSDSSGPPVSQTAPAPEIGPAEPPPASRPNSPMLLAPPSESKLAAAEDDGNSLRASPTEGRPIEFKLLPQGAQFFAHLRPAQLAASPEMRRTFRALQIEQTWQEWFAALGLRTQDVTTLVLALYPNNAAAFDTVAVVTLPGGLPNSWKAGQAGAAGTFYEVNNAGLSAWIPANDQRRVVIGEKRLLGDLDTPLESSPVLRRRMEAVRQLTDDQRLATILTSSQFLDTYAEDALAEPLATLVQRTADFWDWQLPAVSASLHCDDAELFVEWVLSGRYEIADRLPQQTQESTTTLSQTEIPTAAPPLDRLAQRWPAMANLLAEQIRVSQQRELVIGNLCLPSHAAHNLALLSSSWDIMATAQDVPPLQIKSKPLVEILKMPINFDFQQQSLEFALRDLETLIQETVDAGFSIAIDGPALQTAGITRNQQITDFVANQQSVANVLTGLVTKATVDKSPNANNQLIWAGNPDGAQIVVTTKSGATSKGYRIPRIFKD